MNNQIDNGVNNQPLENSENSRKGFASKLSRKDIDALVEYVKTLGAKGLAWIRLTDDGIASSFAKFMTEDEMNAILKKAGAEKGDVVFIIADTKNNSV